MKLFNILFLYSATIFSRSLGGRIFFEKCNYKGFTCQNASAFSDTQKFTYQCNERYGQDVTIYLWQFLKPSITTILNIKDCQTVRFYFGCTSDTKNDLIQQLHIQNVKNLHFIPAALTHNPPIIIFENITNIPTIPTNTFSQIKNKSFKPGCFNPTSDFDSIIFQNVNIGTIQREAFNNLTSMKYFRWENVTVKEIKAGGMKIEGNKYLQMQILNSEVGFLEPLAIQVFGEKLVILGSTISEVFSNGLSGALTSFEFSYNNMVKNMQSGAFSILAQDVDITANNFEHLHSGALQKITPKSSYNFRRNFVKHVDAGGLHPDFLAYNGTDLNFVQNSFHCTCEGLSWLGEGIRLGVGYNHLEDFHKMLLDVKNNNTCAFVPCILPLKSVRRLILPNGKCKEASRVEICSLYKFEDEIEEDIVSNLGYLVTVNVKIIFLIVFVIL